MPVANPLAGYPLDYLIGKDGGTVGQIGRVAEVGYDVDSVPSLGASIAYCNLRREDGEPDEFAPYLPHDKLWEEYPEGRPHPDGPGFAKNIRQQCERRRAFKCVEFDNWDSYRIHDVMEMLRVVEGYGLTTVAKNPGLLSGSVQAVAHPIVFGIIVEHGAGLAGDMDELRKAAGKPDLPVWFVSFGQDQLAWARSVAAVITSRGYINMGVTWSSVGEYGNSVVILDPIKAAAARPPAPQQPQRPSMAVVAVPPASNRIWRGEGNKRVAKSLLMLYDQVDSMLPASRKHGNDGTVGDAAHQATASDHNPNEDGIVTALDITDDPASGFDADAFAESLRRVKDDRIEYIIWRGRICSAKISPWQWRERNKGPGDHTEHVHISVENDIDNPRPWVFDLVNANSPTHSAATHPKIRRGDRGPAVVELQTLLGFDVRDADGIFGGATDAAVRALQASNNLFVDGIVGSHTWGLLTSGKPGNVSTMSGTLSPDVISSITALARNSSARLGWSNGTMPVGCANGLAVSYGIAYRDLKAGTSAALAMARSLGSTSTDALAHYGVTANDPVALLRADFQLLFGSAMRESSGNYSEGVDTNAGVGRPPDEIEAGLLQQSWNSHGASPELPKLLAQWRTNNDDGLLSIFREGVTDLHRQDFGSGDAALFQHLCKTKPLFAVYCAAIGQRVLRAHWGPISRHEAQMRPEVDALLLQVQAIVDAIPEPQPKPIDGQILHPGQPDPAPISLGLDPMLIILAFLMEQSKMANQPLDLSKLLAVVQNPVVHKLITGGAVTLQELMSVPRELRPMLLGTDPVALPAPDKPAEPASAVDTARVPVSVPAAPPVKPLWANLGTAGTILSGIGTLWATGTMPDTAALVSAGVTAAATFAGIPAPIVNGVLGLFRGLTISRKTT